MLHVITHTETRAPYGTYNVTGAGSAMSWADVAPRTFALAGFNPDRVSEVTTAVYFAEAVKPVAPRPNSSVMDLTKIKSTGYLPVDADQMLVDYVRLETLTTQQQDHRLG